MAFKKHKKPRHNAKKQQQHPRPSSSNSPSTSGRRAPSPPFHRNNRRHRDGGSLGPHSPINRLHEVCSILSSMRIKAKDHREMRAKGQLPPPSPETAACMHNFFCRMTDAMHDQLPPSRNPELDADVEADVVKLSLSSSTIIEMKDEGDQESEAAAETMAAEVAGKLQQILDRCILGSSKFRAMSSAILEKLPGGDQESDTKTVVLKPELAYQELESSSTEIEAFFAEGDQEFETKITEAEATVSIKLQRMLDQCIGESSKIIRVVTKSNKEFTGTLCAVDAYGNMMLQDVEGYEFTSTRGVEVTNRSLEQILLINGQHVELIAFLECESTDH